MAPLMLGSMLTRQYRFATRGLELTLRTARHAIGVAGEVVDEVTERLGIHDDRGGPETFTDDGAEAFTGEVVSEAQPRPAPPAPRAKPPAPAHVSTEPELVEEFSEPGAENGAGAQVRVDEPWPGYRHLKAHDVVARLSTASPEELAAVELFERGNANRRSVVVAAQRALKKSSPPRGTTDQ